MTPIRKCCGRPAWNHPTKSCNGRSVMVHEKELLALRELAREAEQLAIGLTTGALTLPRMEKEMLDRLVIKVRAWNATRPRAA